MKKFAIVFLGVVAALLLGAVTLQAQIPKAIQTWDFETTLGSWMSGGEKSAISLSAEQAAGGTQSIKLVKPATGLEINLQNDAYKDLKKGDQVSFKIWMSAADQAMVNGVQLFWQTGAGWSWNSIWINGSDITGDAWTTITREMANDVATPLQRIGVQVLLKAGNEAATPAVYIDDFTIIRMVDITIVKDWGKTPQGTAWPILNTAATPDGDAGMGNNAIPTGWATIRGQFSETMEATTEQAVVVYGQLEFVGGGGASNYTHLRYALTYQDSATLKNQKTDSAAWVSTKKHFGYGFHPRTGTGTMSNGNGGAGVVWTIKDGSWSSTWSNNGLPISAAKQAPRDAVMEAGIYNFAISVQPLPDGNNEVRWYMVEQKNKYWYGGTTIDTAQVTTKFNGICFGFNKDTEATQVNFYAVEVDMGEPITVPEAPWEPFYVSQWGKTTQGTAWPVKNDSTYLDGDATLGNGAIPTGWATIRGAFGDPVTATLAKAVIVRGQMELVGGGGASNYTHLRYALTYQDSSVLNYQYTDSAAWVSTKKHFGYGFHPRTGTGTMSNGNGGAGVVWTIKDGSWSSTWSNNG
ncbi:MAG TPA: hypothetical protein PKY55_04745, partial [bacterium]|nr:hypothetical protein [bacterium]